MLHKKDEVVEHQGLEERMLMHDKQLVKIDTILSRVAENQDKMSDSMDKFTGSITKFVAMQEANQDSFKRVHKRMDEIEDYVTTVNKESKGRKKVIDEKLDKIDLVFMAFKYPKVLLLTMLGLYAFAISDIREMFLAFLRLL